MKRITLFFIVSILYLNADAQTIIQGTIKDITTNSHLIGAFVTVKGTKLGAVSDLKGNYQLIVPTTSKPQKIFLLVNHLGFYDALELVEVLPIDDGETLLRNFDLEPDPLTLKDVTVTANRVEEELQDVPIAASVLDAKNLKVRTVSTSEEAFETVPNLVFDSWIPGRSSISLRGLATSFANSGIENSVGLYIDEVFQSRSYNFNNTLMDIERVEVLRGPQGTLFGKNTIGGLLHLISEKPKFGNFGSLELSAGTFRYLQLRGKANFQLVPDKLAVRITGAYKKRDGWLKEENEKVADENGIDFYGSRISLKYQASKNLEILLKGYYSKDNKADFTYDYRTPPNGANRLGIDESEMDHEDRHVSQNEEAMGFKREDIGGAATINWKMKDNIHKITSITSYGNNTTHLTRDVDATSVNAFFVSRATDVTTFTQEIKISTPRQNRKLFYTGGFFFLKDEVKSRDSLDWDNGMARVWADAAPPVWNAASSMFPNLDEIYEEHLNVFGSISSTNYAAYVSGSYEVSERIRLNGGTRFSYEEKSISFAQEVFSPYGVIKKIVATDVAPRNNPLKRSVVNRVFSGNIGMDFKTTDKILLYISFSRGFKGAGYNIAFVKKAEDAAYEFKPEFVNNYEFGIKLKQGNRFLFNAAAFVTDFKNKQEAVGAGTNLFVSNAKNVQGQGVELEFTGIWNKFMKTDIALGVLNIEYSDFPFPNPMNPLDTINLSGNKALKSPNFTFKFSPEFHSTIGRDLNLLIRADYNFIGKTYNDILNTERLARKATGLLNARLTISTKDERFSVSLWGKNLTNELFYVHGWSFVFGDRVALNPPRMAGMELRVNLY